MKVRNLDIGFNIENVRFNLVSVALEKLDYRIPMHAHSKNSYEIHYISFGEGKLNTDHGSFDITPGSLFVTGPEVMHEQISDKVNPMTEYCVYVKTEGNPESLKKKSVFLKPFLEDPFWIGTDDGSIHEVMKELVAELESFDPGYELMTENLLSRLIVLMVRKYGLKAENKVKEAAKPNTENLMYLTVEEAFLYDYRDITLEKLSKMLKMSARQTERFLKEHYNKTFLQKKTEARMSAAINMLKSTDMPVSAIAFEAGYSTGEHFSAALKKYSNTTATAIRKASRLKSV
ncbi:MAG: helix-turn-helix transcriptional regulator [Lachnospiraceae bacterium]|nr:helix-turn-helix transcriptional regulator [Lachnospiraceae bacterium]